MPIPVKLADHQVLAYELHITNFDIVPLTLKRLEVFAGNDKSEALKIISDDALLAVMDSVGSEMAGMGSSSQSKDTRTIPPGKRAVVFLWVELGLNTKIPASLNHRMVFMTGQPEQVATLENFQVLVSHDSVPLLRPPFDGGVWDAGNGVSNDSTHRRSLVAIDGHVHAPERFAIDWVKVGPNGDSHDGTARNENWWGYGEPVHSVADGEVTQVIDGIPENAPRALPEHVTLDNIAGNYVTIRIANNRYATYAHLQPGSIPVRVHDHIIQGAVIGRLGNSGNSTAAHLHFQLTDEDSVQQSEGVPFIFAKFTDLGPGSKYEIDKHPSILRLDSIPGGSQDEVIEFAAKNEQ
jgi:hypothetical protein